MRLPALLLALLAAGCAQTAAPPAPSGSAGASAGPSANPNLSLSASGDFAPDATQAIVYDRKLAPEGSRASLLVESEMEAGKTARPWSSRGSCRAAPTAPTCTPARAAPSPTTRAPITRTVRAR